MTYFKHRTLCEICGSQNKTVLLSREFLHPSVFAFIDSYNDHRIPEKYLKDQIFEIAKCDNCGFIWQSDILNDDLMELLYNEWISREVSLNKKRFAHITLYSRYAKEMQIIADLTKKKPFQTKVLDFGMGWGYWCLMGKAFGYDVSGYEVSADRISYAKNNSIKVINNEDLSKKENFDFINAEGVLEHILTPLGTLKELTKALKAEGVIRISVPNGMYIEEELKDPNWVASKNAIHPLEHINCFTHEVLVYMGRLAGLNAIKPSEICGKTRFKNEIKITIKCILSKILSPPTKNGSLNTYFRKQL